MKITVPIRPMCAAKFPSKTQTLPLYDCKCGLQWRGPHPQVVENPPSSAERLSISFASESTWYTSLIMTKYKQYGLEYPP